MSRFLLLLSVVLTGTSAEIVGDKVVNFELGANETVIKSFELENEKDISSLLLAVQTSSPISLKVTGGCEEETILEQSGSVEVEVSGDTWQRITECEGAGEEKRIRLLITSSDDEASGSISLVTAPIISLRAVATVTHGASIVEESNRFTVSENAPFSRKVKLQSLLDNVEIRLTSENVENALEVFISFCPTNKGILYTTSYAPNLDISLRSPRMELYYDAYSCDSNITFYSNTSQPVSPLIIRLESHYTINGTMTVLINGAEPSQESHVADYETGTFTVEGGKMKTIEMKYQPSMENLKVFLDVTTGSISVYLSPCKNIPLNSFYSDLDIAAHQIDVNIENLMANTSCSLIDIDPTTVFLTIKPSVTSTFNLWIPGQRATWQIAIIIGIVLIVLTVIMALIIYFGRRKTGKLIINYFQ